MHVLFVCTGNTCRSPMAAFLLRAKLAARQLPWTVESAGLYAWPGAPMTEAAQEVLARRQIQAASHRSQPVTDEVVDRADVVLTMTRAQADELRRRYPGAAAKIHELGMFVRPPEAPEDAEYDIVDPFGGSVEQYEACARALEELLDRLLAKMAGGSPDEVASGTDAAGSPEGEKPAGGSSDEMDTDGGGEADEGGHSE